MNRNSSEQNRRWGIVLITAVLAMALGYGLQGGSAEQAAVSPFDAERAFNDLRVVVGFGARPAASAALARTREYIVAELRKAGLEPMLDEFEAVTPLGPRRMVNIRAIRPGTQPGTIALAGHYDTKLFDFEFVGASDGGSSTAWLLEMARATADLRLQSSLEFIFFDGEEAFVEWTDADSLYGSRYDVERRRREGSLEDLKALVLVDMIGDRNLNIRREAQSTAWLTSLIWETAHRAGYEAEFPDEQHVISDDHIPFLRAGVPAIDLIDFDYPYWHTPEDTLDKVSAESLKIVADVVFLSLPAIDRRIQEGP